MTIVEQAEHELRLLMLCKPSTARALIDDVKRLRAELAGKRTSQEVSTQMECPDCHAVTRWGRHLDLDCHTIARLRAELSTQETLVATLQEQKYAWDELLSENKFLLAELETASQLVSAIEAAMKEEK